MRGDQAGAGELGIGQVPSLEEDKQLGGDLERAYGNSPAIWDGRRLGMTDRDDAYFHRDLERRYPVIESARGVYLYDNQGNEYLDFGSGISVTSIGCSVTEVTQKIARQLEKTTFVYGGYFTSEPGIKLAERLLNLCPKGMARIIFASSGSQANEVAIKIARQYHCERGNTSKYKVVSRRFSYHGNTLGSLSVSGRSSWRQYFLPYMYDFPQISPPYCYRCPFGAEYPECGIQCARELEEVILAEGRETVSAFIAEPIIGTTVAGVTPPPEYYGIIRSICDKHDVVFIADEVITGIGRTGRNFGIDHWQVTPDIITVAKGLSAGYAPLSAVVVHNKVYEVVAGGSGKHTQGFTYTANPLSCAAGLAVLDYIRENNLVETAAARGKYLHRRLKELGKIDIIGDVRGRGMLQGIEFVADKETREPFSTGAGLTSRIVSKAFDRGLVLIAGLGGCADGVRGDQIQITPAFVISETEIDRAVEIIEEVLLNPW